MSDIGINSGCSNTFRSIVPIDCWSSCRLFHRAGERKWREARGVCDAERTGKKKKASADNRATRFDVTRARGVHVANPNLKHSTSFVIYLGIYSKTEKYYRTGGLWFPSSQAFDWKEKLRHICFVVLLSAFSIFLSALFLYRSSSSVSSWLLVIGRAACTPHFQFNRYFFCS